MIAIFTVNCIPVLWYGRLEYVFGCAKMVFLVGLILFNVVINAQERVRQPNGRFWTYNQPYGFRSQNMTLRVSPDGRDKVIGGSTGGFLALWSALTTVMFSMIGFESVAITAPECRDLRTSETVKMASRKVAIRITILYTLATFVVGLNVPYTDLNLRDLTINSIKSGQNSAFIIAAVWSHVRGWPRFFNGVFIFSATTSGVNALYISSRVLHALASTPEVWPNIGVVQSLRDRLERTSWGVPHGAVFTSWLFGLLAFLATKPFPAIVSKFFVLTL